MLQLSTAERFVAFQRTYSSVKQNLHVLLTMKFKVCLTFVLLSFVNALSKYEGQSTRLLDFASVLSGRFTNAKQVMDDVSHNRKLKHDELELTFLPADIPALRRGSKDFTFYGLEKKEGKVLRKQISIITLDEEGVILMQPYNLKDSSRFGTELPDPVDLVNITPEDLSIPKEECLVTFVENSNGVFSGNWPDCINFRDGVSMAYGVTITCDALTATATSNSLELMNPVPYTYQKVESFPLPDYMTKDADGWAKPCGNV